MQGAASGVLALPGDRSLPLSAEDSAAERSEAGSNGRYFRSRRVPLGGEGRAVSAGLAGRDRAALDDLRLDPRNLADVALRFGPRNSAVERQSGPDEVEAVVAAKADPGRIGDAGVLSRDRA